MPELPEVETVRRGLEELVVGDEVAAVVVSGRRSVRRQPADAFAAALTGRRLVAARRWGKYLYLPLDDGAALVIHLRMSGQLRREPDPAAPLDPHTHVRLGLAGGGELRFVDPRTFGELFVTDELDDRGRPVALAALGPDPLVDGIDPERLDRLAARRRSSLKAFLLDQRVLAGIGNLYADEIAFAAGLRPQRRVAALRPAQRRRLTEAIASVLGAAVAARGSTLRDARYRDLLGLAGQFQLQHAVYGRAAEPCPRCGTAICLLRIVGRSAHYCPRCQR